MTFFLRQSVVSIIFTLAIAISLESAEAEMIHGPGYFDDHIREHFDDGLIRTDSSEDMSHMSPGIGRFLFNPFIQHPSNTNSVTTSSQNYNDQSLTSNNAEKIAGSNNKITNQIFGNLNTRQSCFVKYDMRGKARRVCCVLG